jgi:tetratricopeptide (TPR) repeat protein
MKHRKRQMSSAQSPARRPDFVAAARAFGPKDWLFIVALLAAVVLVYQPVWQGQMLWDDATHVARPDLQSWHGLYRIWFEVGATQQYYPLSETAFWLQYTLWGDAMTGYHLVNIALHGLAAVMVALVLRQLAIPGAYLAAAIFALHPVNVESVAWITEQKNTLSAVFYLGAAMAYLRFDRNRSTAWYLGALGLFVLSLLSKIVTVTLPAALLVIFWWQRGKLSWRRDVLPLVPFFAIGVVTGVFITWVELKFVGAEGPDFALTVVDRCLLAGRVIWFYLGKLLWPADLHFLYPRWEISAAVWWQSLFPLGLLILLGVLWRLSRRWRGPLAGFLFFAGTLFPVLGFLNVYWFTFSYVADHFPYLASLGIIALAAAGTALLLTRWRLWNRPVGYAVCLVVLAVLAGLTWRQSQLYSDSESLYRTIIAENPTCGMAYNNLGNLLQDRGQVTEAIAMFRKALEIKPDNVQPCYNLGNVLAKSRRIDEAITQYEKAVELKPDFAEAQNNLGSALSVRGQNDQAIVHYRKALEIKPDYVEAYYSLGNALAKSQRFDEAITQYEKALELKPDYAEAQSNFGLALAMLGRFDQAIAHYRKALEIKPDYAEAHYNLGDALAKSRRVDEAITQYEKALDLKPDYAEVHNALGAVLAGMGRGDGAIDHYRKALRIMPDYVEAHNNLGVALGRSGQFDEAIAHFQKALKLQPDHAEAHSNLGIALASSGRFDEAIAHLQKALQLKPESASTRDNLGMAQSQRKAMLDALAGRRESLRSRPDDVALLNEIAWTLATNPNASMRDGTEAIELAQRAVKLSDGREPAVLGTLAAAYAEAGRFAEAVQTAEKALELATSQDNAALADALRPRIKLYQSNSPYHELQRLSASPSGHP